MQQNFYLIFVTRICGGWERFGKSQRGLWRGFDTLRVLIRLSDSTISFGLIEFEKIS